MNVYYWLSMSGLQENLPNEIRKNGYIVYDGIQQKHWKILLILSSQSSIPAL